MSEIIGIGLAVVGLDARERLAPHRIPVRPTRSRRSAFRTGLTGPTQVEADTGVSSAEACDPLVREYGAGIRPWASWGDHDRHQCVRGARRSGRPTPSAVPPSAPTPTPRRSSPRTVGLRRSLGTAQAPAIAGLPLEGRHHRGVDDARDIALWDGASSY
ncbi:DNA polymerase III [Streptomyces flaveolus]|uniref:DNA polymerase III n=1 Tax=Streptomyces flaveolus TaxID=67297 RepID=UPI0036FAAD78